MSYSEKKAGFISGFKRAFYSKSQLTKTAMAEALEKFAEGGPGNPSVVISSKGMSAEAARALADGFRGPGVPPPGPPTPGSSDVLKDLTTTIGAPFVAGSLGGAALANIIGPTSEDVDILKKQEILAHYDDVISTLKRRLVVRGGQ